MDVAGVSVEADVVKVVVALEDRVVLDHPQVGFRDERLEDRSRDRAVVEGAEGVADVVKKRAHDILFVSTVSVGAGRRLQAMLQAVDVVAAEIALEELQVPEDTVGKSIGELGDIGDDDPHVFLGAFVESSEGCASFGHRRLLSVCD